MMVLLTADCWLLTADCWLLTADCWLLTGGWRLTAGGWRGAGGLLVMLAGWLAWRWRPDGALAGEAAAGSAMAGRYPSSSVGVIPARRRTSRVKCAWSAYPAWCAMSARPA